MRFSAIWHKPIHVHASITGYLLLNQFSLLLPGFSDKLISCPKDLLLPCFTKNQLEGVKFISSVLFAFGTC